MLRSEQEFAVEQRYLQGSLSLFREMGCGLPVLLFLLEFYFCFLHNLIRRILTRFHGHIVQYVFYFPVYLALYCSRWYHTMYIKGWASNYSLLFTILDLLLFAVDFCGCIDFMPLASQFSIHGAEWLY